MGLILDVGTPKTELQPAEDNNEIGNIQSILAGFASGLLKIPEGFA